MTRWTSLLSLVRRPTARTLHPLRPRQMSSAATPASDSTTSPPLPPPATTPSNGSSLSPSPSSAPPPRRGERRARVDRWRDRLGPWAPIHPNEKGGTEGGAVNGDDDVEGSVEKKQKLGGSKRKVCLLFGYNGGHHQGLQIQTGSTAPTIEGELSAAICKAGGMLESNLEQLTKVKWQRSARTDKGVHAAVNVVSMNLVVDPPGVIDVSPLAPLVSCCPAAPSLGPLSPAVLPLLCRCAAHQRSSARLHPHLRLCASDGQLQRPPVLHLSSLPLRPPLLRI